MRLGLGLKLGLSVLANDDLGVVNLHVEILGQESINKTVRESVSLAKTHKAVQGLSAGIVNQLFVHLAV